jgi:16S rRNA (cytidine1402-2'-O)-methyltransferase
LETANKTKNQIVDGALYVVGTPIGNIADMSARGIHTLSEVDFVAAEDTRVSGILLSQFGIKAKFISCHEHNITAKSADIIKLLKSGKSCAIITDAGMPCISDPGEVLVRMCGENAIPVYVVPGACALTAALAVSGLNTRRFSFEGFLSTQSKQRNAHLESLKDSVYTLIFYESPHRLVKTLSDLHSALGDRKIAVCRELTKLYEEVIRGNISDILKLYSTGDTADNPTNPNNFKTPKGEYVLVVSGNNSNANTVTLDEAVKAASELIERNGIGVSEAAKTVSAQTGIKKSDIYRQLSESKQKKDKPD